MSLAHLEPEMHVRWKSRACERHCSRLGAPAETCVSFAPLKVLFVVVVPVHGTAHDLVLQWERLPFMRFVCHLVSFTMNDTPNKKTRHLYLRFYGLLCVNGVSHGLMICTLTELKSCVPLFLRSSLC